MDTATVLCIVGLLLRISVAVPTHSWDESDLSTASVVVKEGESAEISCMLKESNVAYFWLKGGSLENSTVVASFISGITINDPDDPFTVTENGTLIIKKVSRNDEGNYICRVSSEEISCHGDVFVFVQAVLQDFQLTIEYCEPENSCVISTESTKPTSLTCKATNASPSMKLKWFNGSREIKDNIEGNSLTKGTSKEISSTIKDVYKAPSTLTCQAVDFKTSNDDGMFAHVQFRTPASSTDISPGWMVTAILFIVGFVILFLFVIFITVWPKVRNGKDVETQNSPERVSLLKSNNERLEADLNTKDKEIKSKNDEITKLNNNLQTKDNELKTKSEEINKLNMALMKTNADKRVNESNVTSKDMELKNIREQISKLEKNLQTKDDEITKLNAALVETNADKRVNESNVTSKDIELKEKRQEILKLEKFLETATGNISKANKEHQTQKDNLAKKDLEIQKLQTDLEHLKEPLTNIQKREQEVSAKEGRLIEREADVKKREDDIHTTEKMLTERDTKIKNREDDMKSKESKLTEQKQNIKKQLLDLERKRWDLCLDQMALQDPIRITCRLIASRTGDDARVATKERGGQAKVKAAKSKWDISPKDARFHTVYSSSAKQIELCQSIEDLVENAIDGRNSCLIAHGVSGREHWTTMLGLREGASDALVPYAITKIFKRSKELTALDYKVDVTAKFTTPSIPSTISESFKKVDIANEQTALELLKKGSFDQVDGATDHFVQFFINTTIEQETRTGTLVLGTFSSMKIIKECFRSVEPTTHLTKHISAMTSDGRCRSALITHIHEDRVDETKACLAMVNEIKKMNKK